MSKIMQYVDEFRDPELAQHWLRRIEQLSGRLAERYSSPVQIMEVCGGHTHTIFKYGIDRLLPDNIEFVHGPGCPVCVLPMGRIDSCTEIARQPGVIFCTYGDAMRVPGRHGSLQQAKAQGADVRIVYSPLDALQLAQQYPDKPVVFFALGFETTMPGTAITLQQAKQQQLMNFSVFCQHITIIPTLRNLLQQPDVTIDGFLAPGHVSMIIGLEPYHFISEQFKKPLVVTGFEPLDILQALAMVLEQLCQGKSQVENQYRRIVAAQGNVLAQQVLQEVFTLKPTSEWRGLGEIPESGVQLSAAYAEFDAEQRFTIHDFPVADDPLARCGDVLTGRCKPDQCPLFANRCTPESAFGALMVSSEGACAAYYHYCRG